MGSFSSLKWRFFSCRVYRIRVQSKRVVVYLLATCATHNWEGTTLGYLLPLFQAGKVVSSVSAGERFGWKHREAPWRRFSLFVVADSIEQSPDIQAILLWLSKIMGLIWFSREKLGIESANKLLDREVVLESGFDSFELAREKVRLKQTSIQKPFECRLQLINATSYARLARPLKREGQQPFCSGDYATSSR